ncbi:MAG TPA: ABC transporter ATP-binding protein [Bacillota bacterium]|nr:ABC transporter ATP-binding protein [Bacillota bacterium]
MALVALALLEIAINHLLRLILDSAVAGHMEAAARSMFAAGGIVLFQILLQWLQARAAGTYSETGLRVLREKVVGHVAFLRTSALEEKHSGDYISRLTNDEGAIRQFLTGTLREAIFAPLAALGALIYLSMVSWQLTLVCLVILPITVVGAMILSRPLDFTATQYQQRLALANAVARDALRGMAVVKAYALNQVLTRRYDQEVNESVRSATAMGRHQSTMQGFSLVTGLAPFIICFGLGGYWVMAGRLSPGSLLVFVGLLNHLAWPLSTLPQVIGRMAQEMVSAARVLDILEQAKEREGGSVFDPSSGKTMIAFRDVSFCHESRRERTLRTLTFSIGTGEKVALVGPSGCGKSTVLDLILGFHEPDEGDIRVLGAPLEEWELGALRDKVALVPQDGYLFPGTISDNIALGDPGASFERVIAAAQAAEAHAFIMGLPGGYETDTGEAGGNLSAGQRQRICIARALLKGSPLILFDEPTSALDYSVEAKVTTNLGKILAGKTILVVTHRPGIVAGVDRILVMEHGTIVDSGTHAQLAERCSAFQRLYSRERQEVAR